MITIEERKTKKVCGVTSLFVSFEYNKAVVDLVGSCDGAVYHKANKEWEVPLLNLTKLLDELVKIDDVDITLLSDNDKETIHYTYEPDPDDVVELFKHQVEAVTYGLNKDRWLLLDSPGLGKTLSIIRLAEQLKKRDNIEHCFIICGINTLKMNWKKEVEKYSSEKAVVIGKKLTKRGNYVDVGVKERIEQLSKKIDEFFIIINIESLRSDELLEVLSSKKSPNKFDMVVIDEIHTIKSVSSQQSKNLLKFDKAKYRIGMTGTLILNNILDCFVPLTWIGEERSTLGRFKNYYCEFGGYFNNDVVGYKHTEQLKDQLESVSLRRTKDLLDLPPKIINDVYVGMESRQAKFYEDIKAGIIAEVDKVKMSTANLLAMCTRLRQATEMPSILTSSDIRSAKLDAVIDHAHQVLSDPSEKLVIFSVFKNAMPYLYQELAMYNPLVCTGDVPDDVVSRNIDEFQNNNFNRVILGTCQKIGTGVTLNRAHYCDFISTPWTEGVQTQCEDRIHRINNTGAAVITRFWVSETIDERVRELLNLKGAISEYMIDDQITKQHEELLRQYILDLKTDSLF